MSGDKLPPTRKNEHKLSVGLWITTAYDRYSKAKVDEMFWASMHKSTEFRDGHLDSILNEIGLLSRAFQMYVRVERMYSGSWSARVVMHGIPYPFSWYRLAPTPYVAIRALLEAVHNGYRSKMFGIDIPPYESTAELKIKLNLRGTVLTLV